MVKRFKHRFGTTWLLFRAVKSTKNTGPDKYAFCDYGIGIDALSYFLLLFGDWEKMLWFSELVIAHAENRKKDIPVYGEVLENELGDPTETAEAKYFLNITKSRKKIC